MAITTTIPQGLLLINGERIPSEFRETFEVIDPATRQKLADVARGRETDVNRAVEAARLAFEGPWRAVSPADRGRAMLRLAALIREHREEVAVLESMDVGNPISHSRAGVELAARYWEFYGGAADKLLGTTIPVRSDYLVYTIREPLGVCGSIIPWNAPMIVASRDMAPAVAAGNTCVIKPAEEAPLSVLRLGELALEAGLPPGVINVVPGFGEEAGARLASHPNVDHIAFTGSVETGTKIMKAAADNITPVLLELGGKSPNILFADADMARAIPLIVGSITQNCGQVCSAGSRLLVEESVRPKVVEALVERMRKIRLGCGLDDPDMGPLISENQYRRVLGYLEVGRQEGVRVATGGGASQEKALSRGFFVEPTVFDNVDWKMRVAQEEIFGPVLSVIPFKDVDQALEIANGTQYGLVAAIWTRDFQKAHWLASRIKAGQVYINTYNVGNGAELPFGGYKKSGFGREKGLEALDAYTQTKTVGGYIG